MSIINQDFIYGPKNLIILGKFGKAHGIMGWLKVISLTETLCNIIDYQPWLVFALSKWHCLFVEYWRYYNKNILVKIKGIKDRNIAFSLANCVINIDVSQLPSLKQNEYYWKDLLGCQVLAKDGYQIGKVTSLIKTGANDVLVVKAITQKFFGIKEYLIPFIQDQVIKNVSLAKRIINVDWDYNSCY